MLFEPALTNVGIVLPEPGYHEAVREITRRTGTLLIIDETHTICAGPGGAIGAWGLEPDLVVIGKTIGGGIPSAAYGFSPNVAEWVRGSIAVRIPMARHRRHVAGYALSPAATRRPRRGCDRRGRSIGCIPSRERWEAGETVVLHETGVPWHVTRLGARAEYHFMADPPRTGAEQWANADPSSSASCIYGL